MDKKLIKAELLHAAANGVRGFLDSTRGANILRGADITFPDSKTMLIKCRLGGWKNFALSRGEDGSNGPTYFQIIVKEFWK